MLQLDLHRDSQVPLYQQIVDQLGRSIRSGALPSGSRLPPIRQLATEHGLTRLTVHSSYEELQAQGLVESHVGRGTFVAATEGAARSGTAHSPSSVRWMGRGVLAEMLQVPDGVDFISLAHAFPAPDALPLAELGRSLQHVAREGSAWGYGPVQGNASLREGVADVLNGRGLSVSSDHMLITAGAQQAIDMTLRALVSPGDVILVQEPTYPGILELAAQRGQRVVGVPGDDGGMDMEALAAACATFSPRLLYIVPSFANPTGISLAPQRRAEALRISHAHGMFVLEDDVYGLLSHDGTAPSPLKAADRWGQVIFITSFSKILAPALRLGALVADPSLLPALSAAKQASDLVSSLLLQRVLADFLHSGNLALHLESVHPLYRERRDALLSALRHHLPECRWTHPAGGLSLWMQLPDGIIERDFCRDASARGVGVTPGRVLFATPQRAASIRLSFGMQPPERIERAVAILSDVLREHLHRRGEMFSLAGRVAEPLV